MTAPQQFQYLPQPGYAPQPQPQYQPAPVYPPQPPQQFGQPQGYPPVTPDAPPVQLAPVSIDDFYQAPSVGTPSWSWKNKPLGHKYGGYVARAITAADVTQNTDMNNNPLTFRDGSPQPVMRVPMRVQPDQSFPNGEAAWIVNVRQRDELARAMSEAGAPAGPPEPGAFVTVELTERRENRSGNPSNITRVTYTRPADTGTSQPVAQMPPAPQYAPPNTITSGHAQAIQQVVPNAVPQQQGYQAAPPAQPLPPQPQYAPAPVQAPPVPSAAPSASQQMAPPPGLDAEQLRNFYTLTGQTPPQ